MSTDPISWLGTGICAFAVFILSLFHLALKAVSKMALTRQLESKDKSDRTIIIDKYDELKQAVEFFRILLLIAFFIYLQMAFPALKAWPLWFFVAGFSAYLLLFEWIPRLIVLYRKIQVLNFFLPAGQMLRMLAKPFLWLNRIKDAERDDDEQYEASEEEIDVLIEEAEEGGIIEKEEGDLLKSVVEFGDTIVREIMTPRVAIAAIRKDADIQTLRSLVIKVKHSRIPVFKDRVDSIEGIVVAKDLLEYSEDRHRTSPIAPLIREVFFIPESMRVTELLKELQERKQKMAIVVDEHGGVSGLVTMEDMMGEIVGEIMDEYDLDETSFIEQGPGDYLVEGDAAVEELDDLLGTDLEEDDYITVGGLITHTLGRLPEKGETFQVKGLSIEVIEVDQKKIRMLRVRKSQEGERQ
ncbi:MAG: hemolysin family protein [Candidatus Aminicenantes bacterium]|nr:hemolysin family protein [Candidatus Aminicenantes bacterium]